MEAIVDQAGRIVLPKFIRDALGLLPGTKVDISPYGAGVQVVPAGLMGIPELIKRQRAQWRRRRIGDRAPANS